MTRTSLSLAVWSLLLEGGRPTTLALNEARYFARSGPRSATTSAAEQRLCPEPRRRLPLAIKAD